MKGKPPAKRGNEDKIPAWSQAVSDLFGKQGVQVSVVALVRAALSHGRVLEIRPEHIAAGTVLCAKALGIELDLYLRAALRYPSLFYQNADTMEMRLGDLACLLDVKPAALAKRAAVVAPGLLLRSPGRMAMDMKAIEAVLDCDAASVRKLYWRDLRLTLMGREHLPRSFAQAEQAGFDQKSWRKLLLKEPSLCVRAGIGCWLDHFAAVFACPPEEARRFLRRCPALASQRPETLRSNLEALAQTLALPVDDCMAAARLFPPLLYLRSGSLAASFAEKAQAFGVSKQELRAMFIKVPSLLSRDTAELGRRARLLARMARITGENLGVMDVVREWPNALAYGWDYLVLRYLVARHRLTERRWTSLLVLRPAVVRELLSAAGVHIRQDRNCFGPCH
jgi:hypothetical protein